MGQKASDTRGITFEDVEVPVEVGQMSFEPPHEKTNNVIFKEVRHKPDCTATEDS